MEMQPINRLVFQKRYDKGPIPSREKTLSDSITKFIRSFHSYRIRSSNFRCFFTTATLALGFSARPLFGTVHHLETWTNRYDTENIRNLRREFKRFLQRKLVWPELHLFLCNSGLE